MRRRQVVLRAQRHVATAAAARPAQQARPHAARNPQRVLRRGGHRRGPPREPALLAAAARVVAYAVRRSTHAPVCDRAPRIHVVKRLRAHITAHARNLGRRLPA
eukprot:89249-Chlamydomonas_euryale.AAC.1